MRQTDFARTLTRFLSEYLPGQRNVSTNTIKSYRDTFKQLLIFCDLELNIRFVRFSLFKTHFFKQ